jgi:hypothetical protein
MASAPSNNPLIDQVLSRPWFYHFRLPDGQQTECYLPPEAHAVHTTRRDMMLTCLKQNLPEDWSQLEAVDLACHEGWFSMALAEHGMGNILGIDARQEHVDDAQQIFQACQRESVFKAQVGDIHALDTDTLGRFDLCLMFGLLYHLENPVGALRVARALTKRVCLVETQVAPNLSGPLDWGNYQFVKPMMGSFAIIDETEETHGPEMSTLGICLAPSVEALIWLMQKVGFDRVELLRPPEDAYEQHRHYKRVIVAGYVES